MNLSCFGYCRQPAESNPKTKQSRTVPTPTLKEKWWSKPLFPALKSAKSSSLAAIAFTPLFLHTDPSAFFTSTVYGLKWISCPGSKQIFTCSPFALYHSFRFLNFNSLLPVLLIESLLRWNLRVVAIKQVLQRGMRPRQQAPKQLQLCFLAATQPCNDIVLQTDVCLRREAREQIISHDGSERVCECVGHQTGRKSLSWWVERVARVREVALQRQRKQRGHAAAHGMSCDDKPSERRDVRANGVRYLDVGEVGTIVQQRCEDVALL